MKQITAIKPASLVVAGLSLFAFVAAPHAEAKIDLNKPLNTKKTLYIRKSGTPVYKDPIRKGKVYTYRRKDGVIVRTYVRPNSKTRTYSRPKPKHNRPQKRRAKY